jgi:hypothetical protein
MYIFKYDFILILYILLNILKMFKKTILIIIFLTLHLTLSLKSTHFCILKQQECKGFYNRQEYYHIKCNLIPCHGSFSYECGFHFCTRNSTQCNEYNQMYTHLKNLLVTQSMNPILSIKHLEQKNKITLFNKQLKDCQNKTYEFKSNDFCLNGRNCKVTFIRRHRMTVKTACMCPLDKQSFKCDQYCATNSLACDYYKSLNNKKQFNHIKHCGNHNTTYSIPFLNLW